MAETLNLAAQGQPGSRKTVEEVPLTGLSFTRDLRQYQPLVRLVGWIFLIAGPAYVSIDLQCPLPWWWVLTDSASCVLLGALLLRTCRASSARANGLNQ